MFSALPPERTSRVAVGMSVSCTGTEGGSFSLYHLVRERKQALRESGANHVSRLFVYDEFQKSRLLDRRVTRRRSAQKLRHVGR